MGHQVFADEPGAIGEAVGKSLGRRIRAAGAASRRRNPPRRHSARAENATRPRDDSARRSRGRLRSRLDPPDHREVAHFGAGGERARNPDREGRSLRVGGAAEPAEAAIGAGRAFSLRPGVRRGQRRERRLGPFDADRLAALGQQFARVVQLMRAIGIARPFRAPGIGQRPGDVDLPLGLPVIMPHLLPGDRPIRAVAERRARLEPFGPEAQRHHRVMDGRSAHRLARILAAHLDRVRAVDDALIGPVELVLLGLVGGEILQRPEIAARIEGDDREALLGEQRRERSAAGAGADDREIDRVALAIFAHRDPAAAAENVGRAAARRARRCRRGQTTCRFSRSALASCPGVASTASQGSGRSPSRRT